jgi:hypothetical protein
MGVSYNTCIVTDGLILCLDAANKKSYPGSGATWNDLSKSDATTTLFNSPPFSDNFIDFGNPYYGSILATRLNFTVGSVECWCKHDIPQDGTAHTLFARTNTSSGTFNLSKNTSSLYSFSIRISSDVQSTVVSDNIATINWTHLVGTYDGSTVRFYVNGVLQTSTASAIGVLNTGGTLTYNIARDTTGFSFWNGQIQSVRLYNRGISDREVQQNFNALRGRFGI